MTTEALMKREVDWYRKHGKYTDRFAKNALGRFYVIGDFSWNRANPDRPEKIEAQMKQELNDQT